MGDIDITIEILAVALQLNGSAFAESVKKNEWIQYIPLAIDILSEKSDNTTDTPPVSEGLKTYYKSVSTELQGKIKAALKKQNLAELLVTRVLFETSDALHPESKEILQHFIGEKIVEVEILKNSADLNKVFASEAVATTGVMSKGGYRQDGGSLLSKLKLSGITKLLSKTGYISPYNASTVKSMLNNGLTSSSSVKASEYSVSWDPAAGQIILSKNGTKVAEDSIESIMKEAESLGFALPNSHKAQIADKCLGMGRSPLACLQQLDVELKVAGQDATEDGIRKANPLVLRDLLQAIDFKKNFEKKNGALYYTYQTLDEYKASMDSSISDLLNANPKVGKWITLAATHISNNFNSILNNSELSGAEPLRTTGPFKFQTLPRFNPNNINNFNQLLLPQITNRNQSIARLVGYGGMPLVLGHRGGNQEGGSTGSDDPTVAFYNNIYNFYDTQYKTMQNGLQSFGKRIDDSTKVKMQSTLNSFKDASKNFAKDHALLLQYRAAVSQTPDNNYKPSEEHMRNVIKSLNKNVDVLNNAEINVVKVMNKLQGAIVQLVLKESGKQFAASD